METRLIFAILSIFIAWLHNFTFKVAAEKNYDSWALWILTYLISTVWILIFIFFKWIWLSDIENIFYVGFLWFLNALFYYASFVARIESMKNIDTVIFYPIYKTIWPIIVTFISLFFFWESLTLTEIFWIIIWITIPLLLINRKENKRQWNLFKWLILVLLVAFFTWISSSTAKDLMENNLNIEFFLLSTFIFALIFSFFTKKINSKNRPKHVNNKWFLVLSFCAWILNLIWFYVFTLALQWNFAVVYTINSFSILIPIILSIFFYKDHFDFKKWFVIFLSIVSILLFI